MKTKFFVILLLTFYMNNKGQSIREHQLNEMVKTEYAFAKSASEVGSRDAFLQFIADEGIIFRPLPVNGKKFLSEQESRPGLLAWYPEYAYMSESGDMGFTTGPADFRRDKDSSAIWFGNFCTVWNLQKDGTWKFLIDIGNSTAKPITDKISIPIKNYSTLINTVQLKKSFGEKKLIIELDQTFNQLIKEDYPINVYSNFVNQETRLLYDDVFPVVGETQIKNFLSELKNSFQFFVIDGNISTANDFGYVYGSLEEKTFENDKVKKFNYLRIWKKIKDNWIIACEVVNNLPN